jgi:hypothetical protein
LAASEGPLVRAKLCQKPVLVIVSRKGRKVEITIDFQKSLKVPRNIDVQRYG